MRSSTRCKNDRCSSLWLLLRRETSSVEPVGMLVAQLKKPAWIMFAVHKAFDTREAPLHRYSKAAQPRAIHDQCRILRCLFPTFSYQECCLASFTHSPACAQRAISSGFSSRAHRGQAIAREVVYTPVNSQAAAFFTPATRREHKYGNHQ